MINRNFLLPLLIVIFVPILFLLGGCGASERPVTTYEVISQEEALSYMVNDSDSIILDVRTEEEFSSGHIKNAILIPYDEIEAKSDLVLTDKERLILVYCRSGRRSKIAAEKLVELGYSNVKEFGGIIDWNYEIVTE